MPVKLAAASDWTLVKLEPVEELIFGSFSSE